MKFLAALLFLISNLVYAQAPLQTDLPLPYLASINASGNDQPLIIFLHGYGSNEQDLIGLSSQLRPDANYISVRAPLTVGPGSYQWFNKKASNGDYEGVLRDLASSAQVLLDFINQATAKYHTRPGKVVLIGFSQGAIMCYEVGLRHPEALRGIGVLSGRLLPVLREELKPTPALQALKVFIGHGMSDERLPFSGAVEANAQLEKLGLKPDYKTYFGMGHTISSKETGDLKRWLDAIL